MIVNWEIKVYVCFKGMLVYFIVESLNEGVCYWIIGSLNFFGEYVWYCYILGFGFMLEIVFCVGYEFVLLNFIGMMRLLFLFVVFVGMGILGWRGFVEDYDFWCFCVWERYIVWIDCGIGICFYISFFFGLGGV